MEARRGNMRRAHRKDSKDAGGCVAKKFRVILRLEDPEEEFEFEVPDQFEDDLLKWLEWVQKYGEVKNDDKTESA